MVYNGYYIILRLDLNCWVPVKPWNLKSNREVNSYENPGKKNSDWPKHENLEITVFIAWWTGSFTCWYNLWYHMGTIGIWRTDPKYLFSAKDILQSQQPFLNRNRIWRDWDMNGESPCSLVSCLFQLGYYLDITWWLCCYGPILACLLNIDTSCPKKNRLW